MKKIYAILSILCMSLFAVSCTDDLTDGEAQGNKGYLKLDVNTLVSTHTRAVNSKPNDYNPKTIAVKISNQSGTVIMETEDFDHDEQFKGNIVLTPGEYTISASSAGWDGSDSGFDVPFYTGSTKVTISSKTLSTASVTLTQANVKVTVNYAETFKQGFKDATCFVSSAIEGVAIQKFGYDTQGSAFFPVAALKFVLNVTNQSDVEYSMTKEITDVKARDHFIINYKLADSGSMGGVTVVVDDETHSYNYTIEIPRKSSVSLRAYNLNAWSTFAELRGEVTAKPAGFVDGGVSLQYKAKTAADWTTVPFDQLTKGEDDVYTFKAIGLVPNTEYVYRMCYQNEDVNVNSNEVAFTTEAQLQVPNAGMENWFLDGKAWSPNVAGESFWSTSNPGSTTLGEKWNVTTGITDEAHNGTSAQLKSTYVVIKFAAASLFTGTFDGMIGTSGAKLNWGQPFASRPSALKVWMKYTTGAINRGNQPSGVGAPSKGENDAAQVFCALLTESLKVANAANSDGYEMSTALNWQTDPRVIAYGELTVNQSTEAWTEQTIPLTYHNFTVRPTHLLIVCTSSKWGDYFYGYDSSTLLLDDFSLEYGEPATE